jgi:hypothetical protein
MNEQIVGCRNGASFSRRGPVGEHGGDVALPGILREWRDFVLAESLFTGES